MTKPLTRAIATGGRRTGGSAFVWTGRSDPDPGPPTTVLAPSRKKPPMRGDALDQGVAPTTPMAGRLL